MNVKHAVLHVSRHVAHAEGPTQRNDAAKLSVTPLRTEIRHDTTPGWPALLLTPNSHFGITKTDLYLIGTDARQFDANDDHLFGLANVNRRRPRTRHQRVLRFRRFLQCGEEPSHTIAKPLQLEPFQSCCANWFNHRFAARHRRPLFPSCLSCSSCPNQMFQFGHELRYVFKFEIDRSKANICDFVEFFQASHDHFSDFTGGTFTFGRFLHILFDCIYDRSEEHTSELQSPCNLVCRLLLEKKKKNT